MKPKYTLLFLSLFIILMLWDARNNHVYTYSSGSPAGFTGSPGDGGATCSSCHGGNPALKQGWITSDIPASGYMPDSTYTINATISHSGRSKFGFEVTVEDLGDSFAGALVLKNVAATQLVNGSEAITHTFNGVSGSGSRTWSFEWVAPPKGTGSVTFYAAFNAANNDNSTFGDVIYRSTLQVDENVSSGLNASVTDKKPNVLHDVLRRQLIIQYSLDEAENVAIQLYDLSGSRVASLFAAQQYPGHHEQHFNTNGQYAPGIYLVNIRTSREQRTCKILIGQ